MDCLLFQVRAVLVDGKQIPLHMREGDNFKTAEGDTVVVRSGPLPEYALHAKVYMVDVHCSHVSNWPGILKSYTPTSELQYFTISCA